MKTPQTNENPRKPPQKNENPRKPPKKTKNPQNPPKPPQKHPKTTEFQDFGGESHTY